MRPRKVLRIARWEVTKSAGTVNKFTVGVVLVGILGFLIFVGMNFVPGGA